MSDITLLEMLQKLASLRLLSEEEDAYITDIGNMDEAYEQGQKDGQIILARKILKSLKLQ